MIICVPSWLVIWNLLLAYSGILYDGVSWDLSALDQSFSILSPESHLSAGNFPILCVLRLVISCFSAGARPQEMNTLTDSVPIPLPFRKMGTWLSVKSKPVSSGRRSERGKCWYVTGDALGPKEQLCSVPSYPEACYVSTSRKPSISVVALRRQSFLKLASYLDTQTRYQGTNEYPLAFLDTWNLELVSQDSDIVCAGNNSIEQELVTTEGNYL